MLLSSVTISTLRTRLSSAKREFFFPTAGEAIAAAQRAIERSLAECFKPGMSAEELFDVFSSFGEITFIFKDKGDARAEFDPWKHARKRAGELAQAERN